MSFAADIVKFIQSVPLATVLYRRAGHWTRLYQETKNGPLGTSEKLILWHFLVRLMFPCVSV